VNNRNVLLLCFVCFFNAVNLQAMDSEEWETGSTGSCAVRFDDHVTTESLSLPIFPLTADFDLAPLPIPADAITSAANGTAVDITPKIKFVDCSPSEYRQTSRSSEHADDTAARHQPSMSDCCGDFVLAKKVPIKARTLLACSKCVLIKGFICPWCKIRGCDQFFLTRCAFYTHIKERHISLENIRAGKLIGFCEKCGKMFDCLCLLVDHIYEHLNYRPYRCPYCLEGPDGFRDFLQLEDCIEHMIRDHKIS